MFSLSLQIYFATNLWMQFHRWGDLSFQSLLVSGSWKKQIFHKHASTYLIDVSWSTEFYIQTFCTKCESICKMSYKIAGHLRPSVYKSLFRFPSLLITARASYIWVNYINSFILRSGSLHSHSLSSLCACLHWCISLIVNQLIIWSKYLTPETSR